MSVVSSAPFNKLCKADVSAFNSSWISAIDKYILDLRNNPGGLLSQANFYTDF